MEKAHQTTKKAHKPGKQVDSRAALARRLAVIADPTRQKIICLAFAAQGACVSDLAQKLKMSVATVSHHLNVLAQAGLLAPTRAGQKICYILADTPFNRELRAFMTKYL